jgi:hypothetical protein
MVMYLSPAECGPGDTTAGVPIDAPVLRASDGGHDVESVRSPVIARAAKPRASGVFYLNPDVVLTDFGAEGEFPTVAGGAVYNGIGGVLRGDQNRVVGPRAAAEYDGERGPCLPDLCGLGRVAAGVAARARRRGCRRHCFSPDR